MFVCRATGFDSGTTFLAHTAVPLAAMSGRESSSDSGSDSSSDSGGARDGIELNEYSRGSLHTVQHYSASFFRLLYVCSDVVAM